MEDNFSDVHNRLETVEQQLHDLTQEKRVLYSEYKDLLEEELEDLYTALEPGDEIPFLQVKETSRSGVYHVEEILTPEGLDTQNIERAYHHPDSSEHRREERDNTFIHTWEDAPLDAHTYLNAQWLSRHHLLDVGRRIYQIRNEENLDEPLPVSRGID